MTKLKTELSRAEVTDMLRLYNCLNDTLTEAGEGFDVTLSQLRHLQHMSWNLAQMFDFRPQMDDNGHPVQWKDRVLPDDDRAWYMEGID